MLSKETWGSIRTITTLIFAILVFAAFFAYIYEEPYVLGKWNPYQALVYPLAILTVLFLIIMLYSILVCSRKEKNDTMPNSTYEREVSEMDKAHLIYE